MQRRMDPLGEGPSTRRPRKGATHRQPMLTVRLN